MSEHDDKKKTLRAYVLEHRRLIALGFLMAVFTVSINLGNPFFVQRTVDQLNEGTLTAGQLMFYMGTYLAVALVGGFFSFWMRRLPISLSHRVEYAIRRDVFEHLTQLEPDYYRSERTGDILTRMASDLGHVRQFIGQGLLQVSRSSLAVLIAFGVMFAKSPPIALSMLILMPTMTLAFFILLRFVRKRHDEVQEQYAHITNYTQESFSGIRTIKSFAIEDRRREHFEGLNFDFIRRNLALCRVEAPLWPMMALFFSVGIVILLTVGGRLVIQGRLSLGYLVLFIQYLLYIQWPVIAMGWTAILLQRGLTSWKRILAILEREPRISDGPETTRALTTAQGDIELRHVTVRFDGRPCLDDVSLSIPEGLTLGVTGPTGSGKTLLAALLARLLDPTEGQVFIGVHDIRRYPLHVLRKGVGICPQEPFLFSDTLRHNLSFGLEEEDPGTMVWAADVSQLNMDVDAFPLRYETMIGERGITLSGGQRQRAAIARAVARNPNILILDDVLSAVDTQTEARILGRLDPVMKERTTILISHRISTLRNADMIIVLEQGRITQMGTHEELCREDGYYRNLDELQRLEARLEAM